MDVCCGIKYKHLQQIIIRLGLVDNHLKLIVIAGYINIFVPGAECWAEKLGMQAVDE